MKPNKKYNWTIKISILPSVEEVEVAFQSGDTEEAKTFTNIKDKVLEFTDLKLTKEELDEMLDSGTSDELYLRLQFPEKYHLYQIYIPRESVTNIVVLKTSCRKSINKKIIKEATSIINRCTQE